MKSSLPFLAILLLLSAATGGYPAEDPSAPRPAIFLIGDSTVRNNTRGQMGWGDALAALCVEGQVRVQNRALGGRSSRTFLSEGLWDKVLAELKPGDFVLMQFGHNDGGPLDTGRARASLKGTGDETRVITNKTTGKIETVHTYGWYLRRYISDAKSKAALPIVLSPVPRNIWNDGRVARAKNDYARWAAQSAQDGKVAFLDLNEIVATRYEKLGREKVDSLFGGDHTHTNPEGAKVNAGCVVEGLRDMQTHPIASLLRRE